MKKNNTIIIAEAGVNHNGRLAVAKKLVSAAKHAGANIVKFQTFLTEDIVIKSAKKADYQKKYKSRDSQYNMLKSLELSFKEFDILSKDCSKKNIEFLSTGFDIKSVRFLNSINQKRFKIPSGEITNYPLLRFIGRLKKKVILSTGMSNLKEIESEPEMEYSFHAYLTWGWTEQGTYSGNFIPLPSPLLSKYRNKHKEKNTSLIMVATRMDVREGKVFDNLRPLDWIAYRSMKLDFINGPEFPRTDFREFIPLTIFLDNPVFFLMSSCSSSLSLSILTTMKSTLV